MELGQHSLEERRIKLKAYEMSKSACSETKSRDDGSNKSVEGNFFLDKKNEKRARSKHLRTNLNIDSLKFIQDRPCLRKEPDIHSSSSETRFKEQGIEISKFDANAGWSMNEDIDHTDQEDFGEDVGKIVEEKSFLEKMAENRVRNKNFLKDLNIDSLQFSRKLSKKPCIKKVGQDVRPLARCSERLRLKINEKAQKSCSDTVTFTKKSNTSEGFSLIQQLGCVYELNHELEDNVLPHKFSKIDNFSILTEKDNISAWDIQCLGKKTLLACGHADGSLTIREVDAPLQSAILHHSVLDCGKIMEVKIRDHMLYVASLDGGLSVNDMNINSKVVSEYRFHKYFSALDVLSDRSVCLLGSKDGSIAQFDIRVCKYTVSISSHSKKVCSIHCNPSQENEMLSAAADGFLKLWDVRMFSAGRSIQTCKLSASISNASFSHITGSKILTSLRDNTIRIFDANSFVETFKFSHQVSVARISPAVRAIWHPNDESQVFVGSVATGEISVMSMINGLQGQFVHKRCTPSLLLVVHPKLNLLFATDFSREIKVYSDRNIRSNS